MRRVYHRFPLRCDLDFDLPYPFIDVVTKIVSMNNTHVTQRAGGDLVKLDLRISVADEKTNMVPVENIPALLDTITDEADFLLRMNETILTGDRKIPRAETIYYLKIKESGMMSECFATKEGDKGSTDAYDVKKLISGTFEQ